jgi:hypothetical protein
LKHSTCNGPHLRIDLALATAACSKAVAAAAMDGRLMGDDERVNIPRQLQMKPGGRFSYFRHWLRKKACRLLHE